MNIYEDKSKIHCNKTPSAFPANKGRAVVKGKRVKRGAAYGLEIPCEYLLTGDEFSIQCLKSKHEEQGFL